MFAVGNTFNILSNSRDIEQDWGRSSYDVPHRFVASGSVILPFGNIPRNFFRAPYGYRLDLSFAKVSDLPGRMQLELRADIINATSERLHRLDLSQLVRANNLLTHPTMGSVGTHDQLFNPRVIQLGVRLTF